MTLLKYSTLSHTPFVDACDLQYLIPIVSPSIIICSKNNSLWPVLIRQNFCNPVEVHAMHGRNILSESRWKQCPPVLPDPLFHSAKIRWRWINVASSATTSIVLGAVADTFCPCLRVSISNPLVSTSPLSSHWRSVLVRAQASIPYCISSKRAICHSPVEILLDTGSRRPVLRSCGSLGCHFFLQCLGFHQG